VKGCSVGSSTIVGAVVRVGTSSFGVAVGSSGVTVGVAVGAVVGLLVGLVVGLSVGLKVRVGIEDGEGVSFATQLGESASTHKGANCSSCRKVSYTAANSHTLPVLLLILMEDGVKELPKTATLETPTKLWLKQVLSIISGPKVSIRKLLVSSSVLL
jgi:hypothetical protein